MNKFSEYTRVENGLPTQNMFCDVVAVRPDGIFREMKVFYRARPKKEYFVDTNGIRRKRVSGIGFVLSKLQSNLKIIAWKEHKELNEILNAIYGKPQEDK